MNHCITIEQTTDEPYIKSVFLNPAIYDSMKDDSCPKEPSMLARADIKAIPGFFLKVLVDGVAAGCYWLIWKETEVEAHTALLPNCRGRLAVNATKQAVRWVFSRTRATAITSYAWSDSPLAKWLCRMVGMTENSTEDWPATRNGHPVKITYYKLPKEAVS